MASRVLRAPALHFLCLGACLVVARAHWDARATPAVASDEDLLYREALALRVDASDRAVRERLARLGGFIGEDAGDEAKLEAEARELGLARSDLVVRRHLVEMMRLAAGRLRPEDIPSDAEIAARAAALEVPARTRFTHVYVSRARHGTTVDDDARDILATLRTDPSAATRLGDGFPLGSDIGPSTDHELDQRFGPGFATAISSAPLDTWSGPIASTYGLHLVRVTARLPATTPSLDAVRGRVTHELLDVRREQRTNERLAALRAR